MATVKIKLRPSSVEGKAGVIFYQITHNRKTQHITTRLRVQPFDWNADKEKLEPSAPNRSMIQNCIDCDVAWLQNLTSNLATCRMNYWVNDIISRYKSPQNHILVLDYMRIQIEQLRTANRLGTAKNYEKTMCFFGSCRRRHTRFALVSWARQYQCSRFASSDVPRRRPDKQSSYGRL